jgi:transcriptional regulator with XRE-family HTH domain
VNTFSQHISSNLTRQAVLKFATPNDMKRQEEKMALADRIRGIIAEMPGPEYGKQARLARIAGTGRPAVNNWLNAQKSISEEHAKKICDELGYRLEWLLEGKGPRKKGEHELQQAEDALQVVHVTAKEWELVQAYRRSDGMGRSFIDSACQFALKNEKAGKGN